MGNLLLEKGKLGNRLVPMTDADFKKRMKAGTLKHLQASIYEAVEADSDQTYKTRDMEAEGKAKKKVVKKKTTKAS